MGEVYQAKDQKLGRGVAIKVLPEEFTRDTDRVARFQREAKLLASLNHPNIEAIYGLEESGGTSFPCPRTDRRPHAWLIVAMRLRTIAAATQAHFPCLPAFI